MEVPESVLSHTNREALTAKFQRTRTQTERLTKPLAMEDFIPQPITDVSPPRWHLAHSTWFFEKFILEPFEPGYKLHHPTYNLLFNSYYLQAGDRWQRAKRGHLTRPTVNEIFTYREAVNERLSHLLELADDNTWEKIKPILNLGINHEQQHQELLIYDLKYILCNNPMEPVYNTLNPEAIDNTSTDLPNNYHEFLSVEGGVYSVGHQNPEHFAYDNEEPAHEVLLPSFTLRRGLVTNAEVAEFISDGGYQKATLWLDDAWSWLQQEELSAPLYWHKVDGDWHEMTLNGLRPLNPNAPVTHISFYEAEAFATWAGYRLPTEFEWEVAAQKIPMAPASGNFQEQEVFHPIPPQSLGDDIYQLMGDVWEWTYSAYLPYPGFKVVEGALGEYNGKFMINQMVLRGGSCATPKDHIRHTYRNFFHPDKRWIFSGIRLAK